MSEREALQGFLDKWRAQWPEWAVAEVFVPEAQRECVQAWLALRDELNEAAWGGEDPRPGEAKLGWWAEELEGWSRGIRRHPLGLVLQKQPAPWSKLAACLPALHASRVHPPELEAALLALQPVAEALAGVARQLFDTATPAPARNIEVSLLAERVLRSTGRATLQDDADSRAWARSLLVQWPRPRHGSRPGRIHAAIVRGRLQHFVQGKPPVLSRFKTLALAWRAARG
ncbi:MAG: phytoene/squalene synthase family protein [Thermomonas sp.]|nr:MAG: phytoene/squalene synthase family protein [Thermomonas sp.]